MGNASSTVQKIHNIIEIQAGVDAVAKSTLTCEQDVEINAKKLKNCPIVLNQECYAMANANLDTVIKALQSAELDKESKQAMEGLSLNMNVDVSKQDMRQEVLQKLEAKCKAEAIVNPKQKLVANINKCDGSPITLYQYGDAAADCVVKTIIDSQQKSKARTKKDQKNEGLKLPDFMGSAMMAVAAVIILPLILGMSGKSTSSTSNNSGSLDTPTVPRTKRGLKKRIRNTFKG